MAIDSTRTWEPDWAIAPGEILQEVLEDRGMTQAELARRTDRPLKTINEIVKGKTAVTPETAIQFERALGITARFWNTLEGNYRQAKATEQSQRELESNASWIERFPVKDLVRWGELPKGLSKPAKLEAILTFFRVSSPSAWENSCRGRAAAFRASPSHSSSVESVATWLRWGEIQASGVECDSFNPGVLLAKIDTVRAFTALQPASAGVARARDLFASCGLAVVLTPELVGAPISGAARWLSDKPYIQLSLRHKSDDQFWFSLMHEAGHILLNPSKSEFVDGVEDHSAQLASEEAADQFARDRLLPPEEYARFSAHGDFSASSVRAFARTLQIAPGIVVGRLQRDKQIPPSSLNHLKRKLQWQGPAV